jgi:NADH-quinone oxidoreductase subunit L
MVEFDTLYLVPLLPLLGASILALLGRRMDKDLVSIIALGAVLTSFLVTVVATYTLVTKGTPLSNSVWTWIDVGRFTIEFAFGFDQLTAALLLVVTGVGFLIHLYSTGYMHDDPSYHRYFAYLNLFIAAMSVLVLGRSLPMMFIGWEGVGLASYLLIGFWFSDSEKASAGRKAFIVNRIGDFGFLVGIFALLSVFGTLEFSELKKAVAAAGPLDQVLATGVFAGWKLSSVLTLATLSLFVGATGKSAQIPLYVWLPDAMAGPTPVSALIHAATMVTSGIFLASRLSFLFDATPLTGQVVAWVGGATAVFAASMGLAQNDIKKVLAYSTVSQLGYMFLAVGLGAYAAAMFHVITHAFFKACMFLGSGTVIHALHGEQDIKKMGGLHKPLLWTCAIPFYVSTLAIAGVFPFSGFFSKDLILAHAFTKNVPLFVLGLVGAALTAFYMGRLVMLTFMGKLRHPDPHAAEHLHLPGVSMAAPVMLLGALAVLGGALNLPHILPAHGFLEHWLQPVLGDQALEIQTSTELTLWAVSMAVGLGGLGLAFVVYKDGPSMALDAFTRSGVGKLAYDVLFNKWYVDELYQATFVRATRFLGSFAASFFDPWVIDGILVKLLPGAAVKGTGSLLRKLQTGNVQAYAALFVFAAAIVSGWAVLRTIG